MDIHGLLMVDKPRGISSTTVVQMIKRTIISSYGRIIAKKIKIGHCGTLDPFASGLLVVALGNATKIAQYVMSVPKRYRCLIHWGSTTDTLDCDGSLLPDQGLIPDEYDVRAGLERFISMDNYMQRPPSYSAVKIFGKRAYKIARSGGEFSLLSRHVSIYHASMIPGIDANIIEFAKNEGGVSKNANTELNTDINTDLNTTGLNAGSNTSRTLLEIDVSCGFYVRSFARDLAQQLNTFAYLEELRRLNYPSISMRDGNIDLEDKNKLNMRDIDCIIEDVKIRNIDKHLVSIEQFIRNLRCGIGIIHINDIDSGRRFALGNPVMVDLSHIFGDRWMDVVMDDVGFNRNAVKFSENTMKNGNIRREFLVICDKREIGIGYCTFNFDRMSDDFCANDNKSTTLLYPQRVFIDL